MKTRKIGHSDLDAGVLSMGTWAIGGGTWWGENDDEMSVRTIHYALENDINWIDTAPVYGFGHSEEVVGKALKDRRESAILSTKCALQWEDKTGSYHFSRDGHDVYRDLSARGLRRDLENSLRRLQTDYIDVYYTHWQAAEPAMTPIEETMGALMQMKKEGKIRAIGASNVAVKHLEEYVKYGQLDVIQEKFSIVDRRVEAELLPFCEKYGISLQTYSPIERGLLTGKIGMDYVVKPGEVRDNQKWWRPENRKYVLEMLQKWTDLTQKYNCTLGNLVIAWTVARNERINVLCGARKLEQIAENVQAADIFLEKADLDRMTRDADEAVAQAE